MTWIRVILWHGIGFLIYFLYGYKNSRRIWKEIEYLDAEKESL
jgi:APA family basic amino acid/polyamine antiporter